MRSDHGAWRIVVRVERFPKGRFHGTVRILHGNAEPVERSLDDDSCKDLATALAVVAAITIENAPRTPVPLLPEPVESPIDMPPPVLPEERIHLRAGAGSEATSFLSPVASAGIALFFEGEAPKGFFAPRVRLGAHFATSFPFNVGDATANVTCYFARIELGGLRLRFARALALRLAAITDIGAIHVEGHGNVASGDATAPFFDAGAVLRLAWETPIFFIEVGGGAVAAITRPTFHFDVTNGGAPVMAFEVPPAGAIGEVGVGLRFF